MIAAGRRTGPLRSLNPFWLVMLVVVVVTSVISLWVMSSDARREIDALATANADSSQWTVAQAEVELLTLVNALLQADRSRDSDLSDVRQRFDVFYARVRLIRESQVFTEVRQDADSMAALDETAAFLDRWVSAIDGPDEDLRVSLAAFADDAQGIREPVRTFVLGALRIFAEASEAQRARVTSALLDLALITVALFLILIGTVLALLLSLAEGRRQTARIAAAQSRLRAMVGTSLDGILVVDRDGRVRDVNGAAERIFGYSPSEAVGQPMAELIVPDHLREAHDRGMKAYLETGRRKVIDAGLVQLEARDKSGRIFPVELSLSTAQSDEGEVFISYIRDISDRVAAERDLVEARDSALAGEKAKAELLAVMSHEMRTPLNGLLGSLELLSDTELAPPQRQLVDLMDSTGHMLLEHVNTVLDISRADAGKVPLTTAIFDLPELMRDVADSLAYQAQARGNAVSVSPCTRDLTAVRGDRGRLRQILVNLLANAIKFTRDGDITLSARRKRGTDRVVIHVIDTGIGIDPADQERIFEDFVTLDSSYAREVEGTGLGLGIVRRFTEAMGGDITVESAPGEGSDFRLRLPLEEVRDTDGPRAEDPSETPLHVARMTGQPQYPTEPAVAGGARVLIVEDNDINQLLAMKMLADLGYSPVAARDGMEGVALAGEEAFDLILMDISMPRLDGCEATRRIRDSGGPNARTPIVALTAHALPADIARFQQAGMTDVIVKPVSKDRLSRLAHNLVPAAESAAVSVGDMLGPEAAKRLEAQADAEIAGGMEEMRALLRAGGAVEEIGAIAHKLAGLCAVLGRDRLRNEFVSLDLAAQDLDDDAGDRAALAEMLDGIASDQGVPGRAEAGGTRSSG